VTADEYAGSGLFRHGWLLGGVVCEGHAEVGAESGQEVHGAGPNSTRRLAVSSLDGWAVVVICGRAALRLAGFAVVYRGPALSLVVVVV